MQLENGSLTLPLAWKQNNLSGKTNLDQYFIAYEPCKKHAK